jgi:predicted phage terminase large subunit-like protein
MTIRASIAITWFQPNSNPGGAVRRRSAGPIRAVVNDDGEPLLIFPDRVPRDDEAEATLQEREGSLMWPSRFGGEEIERLKKSLGPYMASGRLQQSPKPKGGELFNPDWWQVWDAPDGKFPVVDYVAASVDGAWTENQLNDPSAMTVWATFWHPELRKNRVIVLDAWRKHIKLHGVETERNQDEMLMPGDTAREVEMKNARYRQRASPDFGLVEWVRHTCMRFRVDVLLVEQAASGIAVAEELRRLYSTDGILVHLIPPRGDKTARAIAVQPLFAQRMVYAPQRDWADNLLIKEMSEFPLGRYKDLTDTASQALSYLRRIGRIMTDDEERAAAADRVKHHSPRSRLYPV